MRLVNNNAWGNDGTGFSCLQVGDGGKKFAVTYKWEGDASTVKGFPYMKAWPSGLPVQLWNISVLEFSAKWRIYVEGTENDSPKDQVAAYDSVALKTNVAVDMFLSDDITNSTGLGPPIEIMIWPWLTTNPPILPLGYAESTPENDTVKIDGTNYSLYHGWNQQGQHVFSWLAQENVTSTKADYAPLLKYIVDKGLLSGALYLGQLEFGTEVMHAGETTTFEASDYTLRIIRQGDPDDPHTSTSTVTSSTAAPTGSRTSSPASQSATTTGDASANTSSGAASLRLPRDMVVLGLQVSMALFAASWSLLVYRL
jgi:Glycosyl hydrolase family 12